MPTSVDEKTTPKGTLFEQLATNHPWLAEELKKNEMLFLYASVVYAAEDALNLAFSYFSLCFAMNDAFHEHLDSRSAAEFHDFETTPEGLAITIGVSLFLLLFSAVGTYYADTDPEKLSLFFLAVRELWPYMRDMLKAMKWSYKGIRSTLLLVLMLANQTALLYHILFPITIVLGVLAAINRVAIRYMRAQRKKMQKENELLAEEISEKFHALIIMKEAPKADELSRFIHSCIAIQKEGGYDVFYVDKTEIDHPAKYGTKIEAQLKKIEVDEQTFTEQLHHVQNELLCQQLSYLLPSSCQPVLHFMHVLPCVHSVNRLEQSDESPDDKNKLQVDKTAYQNTVIYLIDANIPAEERVYIIDENGVATLDKMLAKRFDIAQQTAWQSKVLFGVPQAYLHRISVLGGALPNNGLNPGCSYNEWSKYKATIKPRERHVLLVMFCYLAVMYSALIDSLYFYLGVLFVAMLNPHLFFAMLAISAMLFLVCMLTRIYEEYDYQRKFLRTQIIVEMSKCSTECSFIELELDRLVAQPMTTNYNAMISQLFVQILAYEKLHRQREETFPLKFWSALMLGFTCGLGFQGVISSLMFFVIAILTLTSTTCPPALIFSFMSVGVACFLFSAIQFVVSYQSYREKITEKQQALRQEDADFLYNYLEGLKQQQSIHIADTEDLRQWTWQKAYEVLAQHPHLQKHVLLNAKRSMDRCALDPIQKFDLLGWWEVLRLLFSGGVKGGKTYGELTTAGSSETNNETQVMRCVAMIFIVLMGINFALRAIAKMFPISTSKETPTAIPFEVVTYPPISHEPSSTLIKCSSCGSGFFNNHRLSRTPSPNISDSSPLNEAMSDSSPLSLD